MSTRNSSMLVVRGLSVKFGSHLAVDSVDIDVPSGSITGLIGPNGAGKTTTFNLICGVTAPTSGRIVLNGKDISKAITHYRARLGIGRTFQRLEVFSSMSVEENIRVGCEIRQGWGRSHRVAPQMLASNDGLTVDDEVDLLMERLGLTELRGERVGELPTGSARLVELGRALAIRPRVLLLDEPASGLDEGETERFGELLTELAASGLGILLVEHDVPLVMRVCAQIVVLNFGKVIASGTREAVQNDPAVIEAYLGQEAAR